MDPSVILQMCFLVAFIWPPGDGTCHLFTERGKLTANCSDRNFMQVPQNLPPYVSQLLLKNNNIRNISGLARYKGLEILELSHNQLGQFYKDDFLGLHNLTSLDIHNNHLQLAYTSYPVGLFRHQKKLISLNMHTNSRTEGIDLAYLDETLADLVSLEQLTIDGIKNTKFGEGFSSLVKLTNLSIGGNCYIRTLRNDTFIFLPQLQFLSVRYCGITDIETGAFLNQQRIHTLDISHNANLGLYKLGRAFYGFVNSTIKVLKAINIHTRHGIGILLRAEDLGFIRETKLEQLFFDLNRIELIEVSVISQLPKTLTNLSAKDNVFIFGLYLLSLSALSNLEWLDVSGQHRSNARPFNSDEIYSREPQTPEEELKEVCSCCDDEYRLSLGTYGVESATAELRKGHVTIYIPPNLTHADFSSSKFSYYIDNFNFGPNRLVNLNLSYNYFTKWYGPVSGLDKLEIADFSHNFCDYISDEMTTIYPALRIFNISSNYLGYSLTNNTFRNLNNLEHLDLSNNKINSLPPLMLLNSSKMKYLDFSLNYMNDWTLNIVHMINLTLLNISSNLFEMLPLDLRLETRSIDNPNLKVDISGNPLQCTCTELDALKWIEKNTDKMAQFHALACMYNERKHNFTNLKDIILELDKSCASYVGVTIGVLALVLLVLAVALGGIVFRYRWKLRYLYYLALNRYRGYLPQQQEEQHFEFDAFVSYADEDRGFVVRDMRLQLEEPEAEGQRFRLCIHHRDFLVGEAIAANIMKAIGSSRKTVVVLTRNFLRSYWCKYEVEMAKMESIHTGRNTLVIIVMEDIPVKDLPADIVEVLGRDCYVEFTNDAEGRQVFWGNLKRAIAN